MKQFKVIAILFLCLSLSACSLLQKDAETPVESPVVPTEEQEITEQINTNPVFDLSREEDPSFSGELADHDPAEPEQSEATDSIDDLLAQLEEPEEEAIDESPEESVDGEEIFDESLDENAEGEEASEELGNEVTGDQGDTVSAEEGLTEPIDESPAQETLDEHSDESPEDKVTYELPNTGIFLEDD